MTASAAKQFQAEMQRRVESMICHTNGSYAPGVLADFHEALNRCETFSQRQRIIRNFERANR